MRCFIMFVTAVCFLFLLKLKWPKNKSFYSLFLFQDLFYPKEQYQLQNFAQFFALDQVRLPDIRNFINVASR